MNALRILCACVLAVGLVLSSRALYLHAKAELAGLLIRRAWAASLAHGGSPCRPWPWADSYPVARLRIPRLGYDEIVLDNASGRTLAFGPAVVLSGARVGGPGNLVLAGHRTSWFRKLEDIAEWDRIELEWYDASQRKLRVRSYSVESITVVEPQDLRLVADDGQYALTLVTCYPFGLGPRSPQRFVVRAGLTNLAEAHN
jgi:sortase A